MDDMERLLGHIHDLQSQSRQAAVENPGPKVEYVNTLTSLDPEWVKRLLFVQYRRPDATAIREVTR